MLKWVIERFPRWSADCYLIQRVPLFQLIPTFFYSRHHLGWGAKFGSDEFELKGHLLSMVV